MSSLLERPRTSPGRDPGQDPDQDRRAVTRLGHLVACVVNAGLLWASHQLLGWGWPAFLTDDFESVLGVVTASFAATILVNLGLAVRTGPRLRVLADLVTGAFAMAVALRTWEVFPFDFSDYRTDWSALVHVALVVVVVGTGIAILVNLVRLVAGPVDVPPSDAQEQP